MALRYMQKRLVSQRKSVQQVGSSQVTCQVMNQQTKVFDYTHLQLTTVEQSTTAQPVTNLGLAAHYKSLQVAESHLSTAHLTGGED